MRFWGNVARSLRIAELLTWSVHLQLFQLPGGFEHQPVSSEEEERVHAPASAAPCPKAGVRDLCMWQESFLSILDYRLDSSPKLD